MWWEGITAARVSQQVLLAPLHHGSKPGLVPVPKGFLLQVDLAESPV
jgi:hypothetical protein